MCWPNWANTLRTGSEVIDANENSSRNIQQCDDELGIGAVRFFREVRRFRRSAKDSSSLGTWSCTAPSLG
jgi:hypothetical protein